MDWLTQYISSLGCVNPKDLRIEEAMQLKNANLPQKLYKYRYPTEYAIENLRTDTVWLNKPSEYNDPFEFAEYIDFSQLQKPINADAAYDVVAHFADQYPLPVEVKVAAMLAADPMDYLIDYTLGKEGREVQEIATFKTVMKEVMARQYGEVQQWKINLMQDQMKVCSFCESHEQLLMWSHYAFYHTGFCVEYDIERWPTDDLRRRLLYPVIYQESRYNSTDHLLQGLGGNDGFNPLYAIVLGSTKSTEWRYEKEWRFIINLGDPFPKQNYRMNCQSKVFLGMRMDTAKKAEITEICRKRSLPVYQAFPAVDRYGLEFELIK